MMKDKRLMNELKGSKKYIGYNVLFQWIKLITNVVVIFAVGMLLQDAITGTYSMSLPWTMLICAVMIAIRTVASIGANRMSFKAIAQVKMYLRDKLYEKLLRIGISYHEKVSTSEVVQIAAEGVEQMEIYVGRYLPQLYYSMLAPVTLFIVISRFSFKSAAILLACVPLIPLSIIAFQKLAKRIMKKYWNTYAELGDDFLENIQGLTTLKIYQADGLRHEKMNRSAEAFRVITMKLLRMQLNSIIIMNVIAFGGAALAIIIAGGEYIQGNILFWQAFAIILLGADFFIPLRLLGSYFHVAMNGTTACDRLFKILDFEEKEAGPVEGVEKKRSDTAIELDQVRFAYEKDSPILKEVSVKIEKGEFVSIVGKSGCGKSTIAGLIAGHLTGYGGGLYIDGTEGRSLRERERMKKITLISHDSFIFKGTVRENLLLGKGTATDEELYGALEKVHLKDFIRYAGGLDFAVLEQGSNLSGGQKQRLAIARAFLHDSDIYLFDEATSNIDVESENDIMDFIHKIAEEKTIVLITHRLANAVRSDRIYVMEDGMIAEAGKHVDLLKNGRLYGEMYLQQQSLEQYRRSEVAYA